MKKPLIITVMVISIVFPNIVLGIRCGNDFILIGDTTFKVQMKLQDCGQVLGKEVVQQSVGEKSFNKVEIWYVRVEEYGGAYCYPLIFESGVLKEIGDWTECR